MSLIEMSLPSAPPQFTLAPDGSLQQVPSKVLYYGATFIVADASGHIAVPRYAVPAMQSNGCTRTDGLTETIDVRAELVSCPVSELTLFLNSRLPSVDSWINLSDDQRRTTVLAMYDAGAQ